MADIGKVLKLEIRRLARSEAKAQTVELKRSLAEAKKAVRELREQNRQAVRRLAALEKGSPAEAAPVTSQSDDSPVRFSGPQLHRLRKRLGLTLHQFATLLDVSAASISNWEAGRSRPRDMSRIVAARKLSPAQARAQIER